MGDGFVVTPGDGCADLTVVVEGLNISELRLMTGPAGAMSCWLELTPPTRLGCYSRQGRPPR